MNNQQKTLSAAPYGVWKIAWKYFRYWITAVNKHGIHPPTLFDFASKVVDNQRQIRNPDIEFYRKLLKRSKQVLHFADYGKDGKQSKRTVSQIAKRSLKKPRYARLLASACRHYAVRNVLELGTSLGITTAYIARETAEKVVSLEGDVGVLQAARKTWDTLHIENVISIQGNFDETLGSLPDQHFDLIYIDGNHRLEPTLRYFNLLLEKHATANTLFVFDDIHYSEQMEEAWKSIKQDPRVTTTADLFFLGFVWVNPDLYSQNFVIRF